MIKFSHNKMSEKSFTAGNEHLKCIQTDDISYLHVTNVIRTTFITKLNQIYKHFQHLFPVFIKTNTNFRKCTSVLHKLMHSSLLKVNYNANRQHSKGKNAMKKDGKQVN